MADGLQLPDAARRFLAGDAVDVKTLPADASAALVAALVENGDAARLGTLASQGGRDLAKEARRGLHRLRSRGVAAEVPTSAGRVPIASLRAPVEEDEAYAAPPDGRGERLVSILKASPTGGYDVFHVHVSDEKGLVEVVSGHGPRKMWRELRRRFEAGHLVYAPVPMAYALRLVEDAYDLTRAQGRAAPEGFAGARATIGAPAPEERAAPHPAETDIAASALTPHEAEALHQLTELKTWLPSPELIEHLKLRFGEIELSQLLVDARQREEARHAELDRAIETTFAGEARERWRRRLLDAAYVYARAERGAEASALRAQADLLGAGDFQASEDAFARTLVEKIVPPALRRSLVESPVTPAATPSKLILP